MERDGRLRVGFEAAVAAVAEKPVGDRPGRRGVLGIGPVGETADIEVHATIAVEVAPGGPVTHDAGQRLDQPGRFRDVVEGDRGSRVLVNVLGSTGGQAGPGHQEHDAPGTTGTRPRENGSTMSCR